MIFAKLLARFRDWQARENGERCWNCGRPCPEIPMAYGDARLHDQRRLCQTCAAIAQMQ
jgi:hypothetical protein